MSARYVPNGTATIDGLDVLSDIALTIETEQIDVTRAVITEPDMKWTYVDGKGHFHAFSAGDERLPTLETDTIEHSLCNCGCDDWTETIFKCRICGEVVEPLYKSRPNAFKEYAPGRKSWHVEVSANGPGAVAMASKNRLNVSVRIATEDNGREFFGVGLLVTDKIEQHGEFPRWEGRVIGIGPLGKRDA